MQRAFSFLTIAFVAGLTTATLGGPRDAAGQEAPIEEQLVDAFQTLFGKHPGQRPNHAKGIVAEGEFAASPGAASLSRAVHFQSGAVVPVTVRLSDGTGLPTIPDGDRNANPHGMAVKFHLPDGSETDIVINSLHFFPVATPEEFRDLLQAVATSPPDSPKPTKLDTFLAAHPSVGAANATTATPSSFATEEYFGINAFRFTNAAGEQRFVRYHMQPAAGVTHLSAEEAAQRSPNFLSEELTARLKQGPAIFHLAAQLASADDPITDATKPWPDDRPQVELGTLTITRIAPDNEAVARSLLFLPGQVTDGIEISDDPILAARDGVYAVSFSRRSE